MRDSDNSTISINTEGHEKEGFGFPQFALILVLVFFLGLAVYESEINQSPLSPADLTVLVPAIDSEYNLSFKNYFTYPPLFFVISSICLELKSADRAVATKLIWFWMTIGLIGFLLFFSNRLGFWPGLLCVTIFIASPMFRYGLRYVTFDIGHLAVVPWFLWALDKSKQFQKYFWSFFSGVLVGVGFLIRWNFPILIIAPVAYLLFISRKSFNRKNVVSFLLFCLPAIASLIIFIYISNNIPTSADANAEAIFPNKLTMPELLLYPILIVKAHFGIGMSLLAFIGFLIGFKVDRKNAVYFGIIFLAGLIIFTKIPTKNNKYILPIIPMLCGLPALLWLVKSNAWKLALLALICVSNLPYVPNDLKSYDPIPGYRFEKVDPHFYIRSVGLVDSNLDSLKARLKEVCPKGCEVKIYNCENDEMLRESIRLSVFSFLERLALTVKYMKKFNVVLISKDELFNQVEKEILIIPNSPHLRGFLEKGRIYPFVITIHNEDSAVWYLIDNQEK